MNQEFEKQKPAPSEEVDLGQLFNAIGRLFERLFRFIASIFQAILSFIIFILKVVFQNIKIIAAVMLIAFILGYAMEKNKPVIYASQMLVRPYFDSKYQLINNVDYFNSLIASQNYDELSKIFEITEQDSKELVFFEVNPGPETENERIQAYGDFLKSIDTTTAKNFTYQEFINNRNIYSINFFEINVESRKKDIFRELESGLNRSFENTYSERQRQKRDTLLEIQKANIMASLSSIDTLREVYITVLKEESRKGSTKISFGEGLSLEPEGNSKTKEFELLKREIEFRNQLARLDEIKVREDSYFDVVSGFQDVGSKTNKLKRRYSVVFPILGFLILAGVFSILQTIKFIGTYKG